MAAAERFQPAIDEMMMEHGSDIGLAWRKDWYKRLGSDWGTRPQIVHFDVNGRPFYMMPCPSVPDAKRVMKILCQREYPNLAGRVHVRECGEILTYTTKSGDEKLLYGVINPFDI